MKHDHQWGPWFRYLHYRLKAHRRRRQFRFCINGWCPMGQYKNGRTFLARPERGT